jgi:hypothetical protein
MTTRTLNETRIRAVAIAKDFSDATRKNAEPPIFGYAFFQEVKALKPKRRMRGGKSRMYCFSALVKVTSLPIAYGLVVREAEETA